jgi:hypothetical protein
LTHAKVDSARVRAEHAKHATGQHRYHEFHDRVKGGHYSHVLHGSVARKLDFARQYDYHRAGDVARRLHLHNRIHDYGNWRRDCHHGLISHSYTSFHFGHRYCGPRYYPHRVWWPHWSTWVNWSWWDHCHPICDPRPVYCRPIVYDPCLPITVYSYPTTWEPLYGTTSGTWVDAPEVPVAAKSFDLQLIAVRFVDAGHPEKKLGPRFRVWFRNNSPQDIVTPFNVSVIAANDDTLSADLPQAGLRVESIKANETQSVDLRLEWEVYDMGRDAEGNPAPFARLHAWVDSHGEISETSDTNNGIVLSRDEILPVDPAAFSTDADTVVAGELISIAGEGLGPEPGQVLVYVKDLELEAEIQGWYDLGVRAKMPSLPLAAMTEVEVVVVRGDGAATNPLKVNLAPVGTELLPAPAPAPAMPPAPAPE